VSCQITTHHSPRLITSSSSELLFLLLLNVYKSKETWITNVIFCVHADKIDIQVLLVVVFSSYLSSYRTQSIILNYKHIEKRKFEKNKGIKKTDLSRGVLLIDWNGKIKLKKNKRRYQLPGKTIPNKRPNLSQYRTFHCR